MPVPSGKWGNASPKHGVTQVAVLPGKPQPPCLAWGRMRVWGREGKLLGCLEYYQQGGNTECLSLSRNNEAGRQAGWVVQAGGRAWPGRQPGPGAWCGRHGMFRTSWESPACVCLCVQMQGLFRCRGSLFTNQARPSLPVHVKLTTRRKGEGCCQHHRRVPVQGTCPEVCLPVSRHRDNGQLGLVGVW